MDFQKIIRESVSEGIVLLRNENTLPFKKNETISIFGRCQINYYKCGTGSGGSVNVPFTVNLLDGFENLKKEGFETPKLNEELIEIYKNWISEHPFDVGNGEWASEPWCQVEMELSDSVLKMAKEKSEKAIFVIGRTAGEDKDNKAEKGSYYLTDLEYENVKKLCQTFESVTIILNVGNIIDLSWIDNPELNGKIKAILFSWQGGMQGGQGCADILCGKKSPSGKLTDSIAFKLEDYASTKNFGSADDEIYEEDIFVGYRYFSTFAKDKVQFPFGFGLSYTKFEITSAEYEFDSEKITVNATVKNIGNFEGKEVVQIYAKCPQGKLGKSERSLCGFAKTENLKPNEAQNIKIEFSIKDLASYDDSGITGFEFCYVLEDGTYEFLIGNDSTTQTKIKPKNNEFVVEKTKILEKLSQCCAPKKAFNRIKVGSKKANGTFEIESESTPLNKINLEERIKQNLPIELKSKSEDKNIKFIDVKKDKSFLKSFVASLSENELFTLVRGEGMMSRKVTAGIASAFGGISEALHDKEIPAVGCADGPSGIRMDNGKEATLIPIGTLLACTWNPKLVEDLATELGAEMCEKNVDILLGPGCNIHRNPLNGRNFEYFSEDPLLSGIMASSICLGLAKNGAIATIKHFALNNQESHRRTENSVVSERAIREIYLKPFEIAVKKGNARSIMTSYNAINGIKAASNYDLNSSILRKEWGFTGLVMTDWWAGMNDCVKGGDSTGRNISYMIRARNDVYMIVSNETADKGGFGDNMEKALEEGTLTKAELQLCAEDILSFITETMSAKKELRPLRNEIFIHNKIDSIPENAKIVNFSEGIESKDLEKDIYFKVEETDTYSVFGGFIKDGKDTLSQSITNVLINDEACGSFECRSTDNKVVKAIAVRLTLNPGIYKLNLEHAKAGITVVFLTIVKEKGSWITQGMFE